MRRLTFNIIIYACILVSATLLVTLLFGNTSWLSGTGLTEYDKVYIGEGGVLRSVGEQAMLPISRLYTNYEVYIQENSVYNWNNIAYPNQLIYNAY